jgi:hypothetical protein
MTQQLNINDLVSEMAAHGISKRACRHIRYAARYTVRAYAESSASIGDDLWVVASPDGTFFQVKGCIAAHLINNGLFTK